MKRSFVLILFFMVLLADIRQPVTESQAAAPALAAPAAAIGALELAALTATGALAIGLITASQNERYQAQISMQIEKIKAATVEMMADVLNGANAILKAIGSATSGKTCPPQANERRQVITCSENTPEACCGDFFSKFRAKGLGIQIKQRAAAVFKNAKLAALLCCLEWDPVHGGYEIFDSLGRHMGERGCDDLSDDPCSYTKSRGSHATPKKSNHSPRSPLCKP